MKAKGKNKKTLISFYLLLFLSLSIIFFEFFFNIKESVLPRKIILVLDVLLILFYFLLVVIRVFQSKYNIIDLIKKERASAAFNIVIFLFLLIPRFAAGLIIVRLSLAILMRILKTGLGKKFVSELNLRPSQTMALSYIGVILSGTILLTFPAATQNGLGISFINALFTMTSATCVTGLTILDTGSTFSLFGQAVILSGIQVGGLGIMVLSASFAVMIGGRITSRRQAGLRAALDASTQEGLSNLIKAISAITIFTEFIGALCLFFIWTEDFPNFYQRLWWSIFHSVSAFCNAGFSLFSNSLQNFVNNPFLCIVIMILITIGGLGFFVITDLTDREIWKIKKFKAIWQRMEIQTRIVLLGTIFLNLLGMLVFIFFEFDGALSGLGVGEKILASFFQVISLRTAGFYTVSFAHLAPATILLCLVLMFIGAAPGSTGGGIKITTAAISLMAVKGMLRGREQVEIMGRTIPQAIVNRSLSILLIFSVLIVFFLTIMLATQAIPFEVLTFETISAFATVGLSMDTTGILNYQGKIIIIFAMYVGRIGPLTLALAIGEKRVSQQYSLPHGRISVG